MMSADSDTELLGFSAEVDSDESDQKPPPRHAKRRSLVRVVIVALVASLLLVAALSIYLMLELDSERRGNDAVQLARSNVEANLDAAQERLAESEEALATANEKLAASEDESAKLQDQLTKANKEIANLEEDIASAKDARDAARAEADAIRADVQESIGALDTCVAMTRQVVAAIDDSRRFDHPDVERLAAQAVIVCESASSAVGAALN